MTEKCNIWLKWHVTWRRTLAAVTKNGDRYFTR